MLEPQYVPYKGRRFDPGVRVEVYRNVNRGNSDGVPWYSIRQNGKVVGHTTSISLVQCYFKVQEAGRQRVLRTKRKNVHAWVYGYVGRRKEPPYGPDLGDPLKGRYIPTVCEKFEYDSGSGWKPVIAAMKARLDEGGLTIWMPRA